MTPQEKAIQLIDKIYLLEYKSSRIEGISSALNVVMKNKSNLSNKH
jgi:hypothetical protein